MKKLSAGKPKAKKVTLPKLRLLLSVSKSIRMVGISKLFLPVLVLVLILSSCSVTNKPGVILERPTYRIVAGNAKHFQQRYDAKVKREQAGLAKN